MEYCGSPTGVPAVPNWSSYAGPDITPGVPAPSGGFPAYPTGGYPTDGLPNTGGAYGPPSTFTTYNYPAEPTPAEQPAYGGEDGEGSEKRGLWRRVVESFEDALGYGGGRSEMSS